MPAASRILRHLIPSWGGTGKSLSPQTHVPYKGKNPAFQHGAGGRFSARKAVPTAPLEQDELRASQIRKLLQPTGEFNDPLGRLPSGTTRRQPLPHELQATTRPPQFPRAQEAHVLEHGRHLYTGYPTKAKARPKLPRHEGRTNPRMTAGRDIAMKEGPDALLHLLPATGKFLLDQPVFHAGVSRASAYWLKHRALPATMREMNRTLTAGAALKQSDDDLIKVVNEVWDDALDVERQAAQFDMSQALTREAIGDMGLARLAKNPDAVKTIQSVYIQANRIRAMQELIEQYGHGGQRRLHDISGMLFARSQALGAALESPTSRHAFKRELQNWEHANRFMVKFGKQAFHVMGNMVRARELYPDPKKLTASIPVGKARGQNLGARTFTGRNP